MQHQQGRLLAHRGAVRHQTRALDIEEQPHAVHQDMHGIHRCGRFMFR
jgi:hypothetical protein